jgi:hypothetical protein
MSQPESKLVKSIQSHLESKGARSFKIHGEDSFQEVGIPDLLVCYRGRFVGLEVKQLGNSPSRMQVRVLREIVSAGGYASVVSTVEEVDRLLAKIDREANLDTQTPGAHAHRIGMLNRSISKYS